MKIRIAVKENLSARKLSSFDYKTPEGKKNANTITYQFDVMELSPSEIIEILREPCAITNVFIDSDGNFHRKKNNFVSADWFALDIDNDNDGKMFTLKDAQNDEFIKNSGLFIYTTPSHTEEKNKFRIFFLLPNRITSIEEFEKITKPISRLYPQADKGCWNVSRFYYGMGENPTVIKLKRRLTWKACDWARSQYEKSQKQQPAQQRTRTPKITNYQLSDKQEQTINQLIHRSDTAPRGERSNADFGLLCYMITSNISKEEIRTRVDNIGKFREHSDRSDYFEMSYKSAFESVSSNPDWKTTSNTSLRLPKAPKDEKTTEKVRLSARDRVIIERAYENERGLAKLFVDIMKNEARFWHESNIWLRYSGIKWEDDKASIVVHIGISKLIDLLNKVIESCELILIQPVLTSDKKGQLEGTIKMLRARIGKLYTERGGNAVQRLARSELTVSADEFDADDYLVNMPNGTYDLKNNTFRDHRPEDIMRKVTNAIYDPNATCPHFDLQMDIILDGDADLLRYLYQVFGLGLTGESPDEIAFFVGGGGNGKSSLTTAVKNVLGEYFMSMRASIFIKQRFESGSNEYYVARFQGARFVLVSEMKAGFIDAGFVKELTGGGGEMMTGRRPGGMPFDIDPKHTIIVTCNRAPQFADGTAGARRRPQFVPFNHEFSADEKIRRTVIDARLEKEISGILNRFLSGWKDYVSCGGFYHPKGLLENTQLILSQDDVVDLFLESRIESTPDRHALKKDVFKAFCDFCKDEEHFNPWKGQGHFNHAIQDREKTFVSRKIGIGMVWMDKSIKSAFLVESANQTERNY